MSTVTTSATPSSVDKLIEPMSKTSMKSPQPPTWTISPVVHVRRDVFSRIVEFDGRVEPYIEPHFPPRSNSSSTQDDFQALLTARWSEYRAERYLQSSGNSMAPADAICVNTPVQLFLAHSRVVCARLELRVYSELLKAARPALLKEFDEIERQSGTVTV